MHAKEPMDIGADKLVGFILRVVDQILFLLHHKLSTGWINDALQTEQNRYQNHQKACENLIGRSEGQNDLFSVHSAVSVCDKLSGTALCVRLHTLQLRSL